MKRIVLFGAGKSATCLIDYLLMELSSNGWELVVADGNLEAARNKIGNSTQARAVGLDVLQETDRKALVSEADIVISLLPPAFHFLVAQDCLAAGKHLLTASYVDDGIRKLQADIERKQLLFLCEMGLDPGIDHMSAMQLLDRIRTAGGRIISFRSHTGGLVAPESDDNPWHYKISWNPRNLVTAGSAGAIYRENGLVKTIAYPDLFGQTGSVTIPGIGPLAFYPNRDSLAYMPIYSLEQAKTFLRTTLRYPVYCKNWKLIVQAGLTDERKPIDSQGLTFSRWSSPILPLLNQENKTLFSFLGLFDDLPVPLAAKNSADILQFLLETRLRMNPTDKDMIVMLHEIGYELDGQAKHLASCLVVKGQDSLRTAMAKTVGLPLGIAAGLILKGKMLVQGLQIPILPSIYNPVLAALEEQGIRFEEKLNSLQYAGY